MIIPLISDCDSYDKKCSNKNDVDSSSNNKTDEKNRTTSSLSTTCNYNR